jgi:hypothetical protein
MRYFTHKVQLFSQESKPYLVIHYLADALVIVIDYHEFYGDHLHVAFIVSNLDIPPTRNVQFDMSI